MIVSRTPFRISFFGGGTDYPAWYREHGGAVLAASIDKYCYLTCRYLPPFFEHRYRVVYSKIDSCHTVEEITHPAAREVLRFMKIERGVEIHHDGDLPARSGMGSSCSFTVGLLHALHALKGQMPSKHQLALESIHIEQDLLNETVGSQDQVLAAYGGLNQVTFHPQGEITVHPLTLSRERISTLNSHLLLFYTGIKRTAADVAKSYVNNIADKKRQLGIMRDLVDQSVTLLNSNQDISGFGRLLHEAWQTKRSLSAQVTNQHVDEIYDRARKAGALGGKLTGAGGGGFMLLFAPPDRHDAIREQLNALIHVPFQFEFNGSQIIFFDHEVDYSAAETTRAAQNIRAFRELTHSQTLKANLVDKSARVHVAGARTLIGAAIVRELQRQGYHHLSGLADEDLEQAAPEYVFVAAGKSGGIGANQRHPATLMLDNLQAATHTIAAAHRCGVKKLLYLASSCCYPKSSSQPMRVGSLLTGPLEPTSEAYALAKIAGLKLCQAYRQEHGALFIGGIVADVFGLAEAHDLEDLHVVPALLLRMHTAKQQGAPRVQIWGSGTPRREFVYADDAANACVFVMQHYDGADPINLGGGSEMSIRELAELMREVVGYKGELHFDTSKPDGMPFKALDSSKLLALGWRAQTPFKSALALTYRQMIEKTPK